MQVIEVFVRAITLNQMPKLLTFIRWKAIHEFKENISAGRRSNSKLQSNPLSRLVSQYCTPENIYVESMKYKILFKSDPINWTNLSPKIPKFKRIILIRTNGATINAIIVFVQSVLQIDNIYISGLTISDGTLMYKWRTLTNCVKEWSATTHTIFNANPNTVNFIHRLFIKWILWA